MAFVVTSTLLVIVRGSGYSEIGLARISSKVLFIRRPLIKSAEAAHDGGHERAGPIAQAARGIRVVPLAVYTKPHCQSACRARPGAQIVLASSCRG